MKSTQHFCASLALTGSALTSTLSLFFAFLGFFSTIDLHSQAHADSSKSVLLSAPNAPARTSPTAAPAVDIPAPAPAAIIGQITSTSEGATVIRDKSQRPLVAGDLIRSGDVITAGRESVVLVAHPGAVRAALKLRAVSSIRLSATTDHGLEADLIRGAVLSDVHNPDPREAAYSIRTRTATMMVRGTVFFVRDEPKQPIFVCACSGKVALSPPDRPEQAELIKSSHHDRPLTVREGAESLGKRMEAASMGTEHSDADVAELEKALTHAI